MHLDQQADISSLQVTSPNGMRKGKATQEEDSGRNFFPAPRIPQCKAFTLGFDSLAKLARTPEDRWTRRFLRVWWAGGVQLGKGNAKYAVLNSQQGL